MHALMFIRRLDLTARHGVMALISGFLLASGFAAGNAGISSSWGEALYLAAAIAAGWSIAARAVRSAARRDVTIEQLVIVAATGAVLIGESWEAAAVTFLFVLGAWLEARTMARTRRELSSLVDLAPEIATVIRRGASVDVDPGDVRLGETVLVRPGSRIPVDGIVRTGRAAVEEAAVTGESIASEKVPGDQVFAGTFSQDGVLLVTATGVGAGTMIARIIQQVEEAQDTKAPAQKTIERFARWYTPAIIALAALVGAVSHNIETALTLLVIACPGALVIATPVAFVAGIGHAARRGILIKGGEVLERVGKVSTLALDKTGTLTEGRPVLTDVVALRPARVSVGGTDVAPEARELLHLAAIAENGSTHPLARPIVAAAQAQAGTPVPQPEEGATVPGLGVWARWEGREIGVGTPQLMAERAIPVSDDAMDALRRFRDEGKSAMLVSLGDEVIGALAVFDRPRENVASLGASLAKVGVRRVMMLTGDNHHTANHIGARAGIREIHAALLPDEKLNRIRAAQRDGEIVMMVGDGINDAPALAAADVGIAMGAIGSDIALETADVALMTDDLARIPEAVRISRSTVRVIRQNLAIAMLTVAALVAGVLLGSVNMAGGMLVHEASVLIVIANGMRLLRD